MRDLYNNIKAQVGLVISSITTNTTTNGAIIDMQGFDAGVFSLMSGTITDGAYATNIQEGDDSGLSDAASIPAARILDALPSYAAADDNVVKRVGFLTSKRYVRLQIVSTGITTGGTLSAQSILGRPNDAAVA